MPDTRDDNRKNQMLVFHAVSGPRHVELKRRHWLVGVHGGTGMAFVFGDDESNARRFVACWNACEELATEALERWPSIVEAGIRTIRSTETERDAWKDYAEHLECCAECSMASPDSCPDGNTLRAAARGESRPDG